MRPPLVSSTHDLPRCLRKRLPFFLCIGLHAWAACWANNDHIGGACGCGDAAGEGRDEEGGLQSIHVEGGEEVCEGTDELGIRGRYE